MEYTLLCRTDTATLAAFDPEVLASHVSDPCDWWTDDFHLLPEVASGQIALVSLSGDGVYKVRVTEGPLTESEAAYAAERVVLGLSVRSGKVFIGPGEYLPGDESSPDPTDDYAHRFFVPVTPGQYLLEFTTIAWNEAPDWYVQPGEPVPVSAPADIVLRFQPVSEGSVFAAPQSEPRVFSRFGVWLYPNLPRRLGPAPGMALNTSVVRRRDELVLKPCGPLQYRPILANMNRLNWNDRILVEVVEVHHESKEFTATLKGRSAAV